MVHVITLIAYDIVSKYMRPTRQILKWLFRESSQRVGSAIAININHCFSIYFVNTPQYKYT